MLCRTSLVCNNDWEKPTANDWILKVTECSRRDNKHNEKMSRRVHPNVHFSILLLWQKYFRASSSTYVGTRCKNKPSTHNFAWFFSNPLLLCTSKKREHFGVSSYSHSLPKINEFLTIARILFMFVFKQVRIAMLLALMFRFFPGFPLLCSYFQALCTLRACQGRSKRFAIIATDNIHFAFPSLQKHRGAKRDNGKTSNLSGWRLETCLGSELALQKVRESSPSSCSPGEHL